MKKGYFRYAHDSEKSESEKTLQLSDCEIIFSEQILSKQKKFPVLEKLLLSINKNDVIVICQLSDVANTLPQLISVIDEVKKRNAYLVSLREKIDTNKFSEIFSVLVDFQNSLIKTRTSVGLNVARSRGRKGGRPGLSEQKIKEIKELYSNQDMSISEICERLNIHSSTLYKYVNKREQVSK